MNLLLLRKKADNLLSDLEHSQRTVREERNALERAKERLEQAQEAQGILQSLAEHVQNLATGPIAAVVTRCLQSIWGDKAYEFKIIFEKKRNHTEARLVFIRDGKELDPTEEASGGMVEVASFGLRLSCLLMSRPKLRRLLVLDEPFGKVGKDKLPLVGEMLEKLCEEFGLQIIISTHEKSLMGRKGYRFRRMINEVNYL